MLLNILATACFVSAVLQTFLAKRLREFARKFPEGSLGENFFHLLGEVEIVFGLWAAIYLCILTALQGGETTVRYLENIRFTEPIFVFVIMAVCATRPVLAVAQFLISGFARVLPLPANMRFLFSLLTLGPLLGSFITEPAAMTVCAFLLADFFSSNPQFSTKFKYALVGLLFVNVSIGGTMTPFAAPPVLMVLPQWHWDFSFMLANFAWKAVLAVFFSAAMMLFVFKRELNALKTPSARMASPWLLQAVHLVFLLALVLSAHHTVLILGLFCFFLGLVTVTREYQDELRLRQSLLVAFFLAGLVVLGTPQSWWLSMVLEKLSSGALYLGAAALTSVVDNAALTFLGSQSDALDELGRYALVAGSVAAGGLTVIANAPNPIGYGILSQYFDEEGIGALGLFLGALFPTLVALAAFWLL